MQTQFHKVEYCFVETDYDDGNFYVRYNEKEIVISAKVFTTIETLCSKLGEFGWEMVALFESTIDCFEDRIIFKRVNLSKTYTMEDIPSRRTFTENTPELELRDFFQENE